MNNIKIIRTHISSKNAGIMLGINVILIRRMMDNDELEGFRLGQRYRVFEDSVIAKAKEWGMIADEEEQ